jgi:hypothetical protein
MVATMIPEFSQRELDELDPHYDRMMEGKNHLERNRLLSNQLRFICDKRNVDLYQYIIYKARQQTEPTVPKLAKEQELKECKRELCKKQFTTGRPDKLYCSGRCRQIDYQEKTKK